MEIYFGIYSFFVKFVYMTWATENQLVETNTTASGLKIDSVFLPEKCEKKTENGNILTIRYQGIILKGGEKYDFSQDTDQPFTFQLGDENVIKGLNEGLKNMCVGEQRRLIIPAHLAYGNKEASDVVAAGATIVFNVELMNFSEYSLARNVFRKIDVNADEQLSRQEVSEYLRKQIVAAESAEGEKIEHIIEKHDNLVEEIFQREDKDKNGYINFKEYSKYDEL